MQENPFNLNHPSTASSSAANTGSSSSSSASSIDELTRLFSTALVSTRVDSIRDYSAELFALVESPAFRAILTAVRQIARTQNIPDREAAELLIQTFRKMDKIWGDYLFQEGIDRLKGQMRTD
jgi:hypothetical protein